MESEKGGKAGRGGIVEGICERTKLTKLKLTTKCVY